MKLYSCEYRSPTGDVLMGYVMAASEKPALNLARRSYERVSYVFESSLSEDQARAAMQRHQLAPEPFDIPQTSFIKGRKSRQEAKSRA